MTENTMCLFFNCHGNLILDKESHQKMKYRNKNLRKLVKIVATRPGEVCTVDPTGIVEYKEYIQHLLAQTSEDSVFHGLITDTIRKPWKTRYLLSEEREPEIAEDERVGFIHKYDDNSFMEKLFEISSETISTHEELADYENQGIFLLKDYTWVSKTGKKYTLPAGFNFMKIDHLVKAGIKDKLREMIEELEHHEKMKYKWYMSVYKGKPSWLIEGPFLKSIFLSDLIYFLTKKLRVENLYYIDMTCSTLEIPDGRPIPAAEKARLARTYSNTLGGGKNKTKKQRRRRPKKKHSTKRNICK